ncbi:MAG: thiol:disulfide interchange protein DsbA/DsbL [Pseudomonadota bacterium]
MTTHRALALLAALLAGGWTSTAGARAAETAPAASASGAASLDKWRAGTNYQMLREPQPTTVGSGKIEVSEVFWYGCGHCYALDPELEEWNAGKAAYVEFVRVPVIWGQVQRQHAKLYYTLQALHRPELHGRVFDAIHKQGLALAAHDDLEARAMQLAFLVTQGVSEKDFNAAYDSMTVATNMLRAENLTKKYAVANVPTLIVNGKYSTSVGEAGGPAQLFSLLNDLAASEKNR